MITRATYKEMDFDTKPFLHILFISFKLISESSERAYDKNAKCGTIRIPMFYEYDTRKKNSIPFYVSPFYWCCFQLLTNSSTYTEKLLPQTIALKQEFVYGIFIGSESIFQPINVRNEKENAILKQSSIAIELPKARRSRRRIDSIHDVREGSF